MLERLIYKNHMNEVFDFGKDGIYLDGNDIRDFEWKVTTKNNRISAFDYAVRKKKLPVIIICDSEESGTAAKNRLFEIAEKDVLAMKHGQIIVGDYYMKGFITKSAKKDYLISKRYMKLTLTLTTDFPYWVKESKTTYSTSKAKSGSAFLDHPFDYPFEWYQRMQSQALINTGFVASNFRLIIYGACANPSISINGHEYQVECTVNSGEYLTIDSATKKIFLTEMDGTVANKFNNRNRDSYIFEKIQPGSNVVAWDGTFGFDVILLEERSEPKWT